MAWGHRGGGAKREGGSKTPGDVGGWRNRRSRQQARQWGDWEAGGGVHGLGWSGVPGGTQQARRVQAVMQVRKLACGPGGRCVGGGGGRGEGGG